MKSTGGSYYIALDHVRALAAFMVFSWHFIHAGYGFPVPFAYSPAIFPLSILDEGHTGVALFMTLSGYLFAKLLDGRSVNYRLFIWNRVLRLFPLLVIVVVITGVRRFMSGSDVWSYLYDIGIGFPASLPNGGWTVIVEFQFYIILPAILWMFRKSKVLPICIVFFAIGLRSLIYLQHGEVQSLAYNTIIGRIDQFLLGMFVYHFRDRISNRHVLAGGCLLVFSLFYWYFDLHGGFYKNPSYPSPSLLWIILPTIEGLVYSVGIAYYDNSFTVLNAPISRFLGRIGTYSYSIYLLHFFIVFRAARFIDERIMDISNFYLACLWSLFCFLPMIAIGYMSFSLIERPFLKLRRAYIISGD